MKLSNRHLRSRRLELSMTSMIDVVFLLLIFFIVSTTFVRPEREVEAAIRVEAKSAEQTPSLLEPAMVDVIRSDSGPLFRIGAIRTNDLAELSRQLRAFESKSEGAFVRVAGDVPYEAAAQAIGACRDAGFTSVSYLPLD